MWEAGKCSHVEIDWCLARDRPPRFNLDGPEQSFVSFDVPAKGQRHPLIPDLTMQRLIDILHRHELRIVLIASRLSCISNTTYRLDQWLDRRFGSPSL